MSLPNLDDTRREHAEQRLGTETIIWLTTVRADGQPQTSPVGFVWDGSTFLVISEPGAPKVRNVVANAQVSLHLETEVGPADGGVLTVEGVAAIEPGPLSGEERSTYEARYLDDMRSAGLTPEEAFEQLSTSIRIRPTRVRSY